MDQEAKSLTWELGAVAALVLLLHWLGSFGDGFLVGAFEDDGVYTVLGKALAEGRGYHSLHLVGSPVQVKYPPGFPMVLSLFWHWSGSVEGVKHIVRWVHPVVMSLAAVLFWALGRGRWRLDWGPTALLVIVPLVLDATIQYTAIPLAEPWFLLGWAGVLLAWDAAESAVGIRRLRWLALAGLLVAVTVLIRSQAIVLVAAVAVGLFWRPHTARERVAALAAAVLPVAAWQLYHHALVARGPLADLPDEGGYASWFSGGVAGMPGLVASSTIANAAFYVRQLGDYLSPVRPLGSAIMALALVTATAGGVIALPKRPVLALGALGSLMLVLLWPFAQDRLLLSTLPVCGLLAALALQPAIARIPPRTRRWVNLVAGLAIVPVLLRQAAIRRDSLAAVVEDRAPMLLSPAYLLLVNSRFIATASHWILTNTAPTARIMIDHQSGVYLYTDRSTIPASPSESRFVPSVFGVPGQYLARLILQDSLTYVIIGIEKPGIMRDIETLKRRCPGVLTWGGVSPSDPPLILRVTSDLACLTPIAAH
jgi:hypothetical protein